MPAMPNIVGRDLQDATAMLEDAGVIDLSQIGYFGLWPLNVDWITDTQASPNTVIQQDPPPFGPLTDLTTFYSTSDQAALNSDFLYTVGNHYGSNCGFSTNLTGWGQITTSTTGTAPVFEFSADEPAPFEWGFLLTQPYFTQNVYHGIDPTSVRLNVGVFGCNAVADVYVRFWLYDSSADTYQPLARLSASDITFPDSVAIQLNDWAVEQNSVLWFDESAWLFVDVVANVTSNTPGSSPSPTISMGAGAGEVMLQFNLGNSEPTVVTVNENINLTVSSLPISVIYP